MVLVDEADDAIERVVMVPGERFIDRETMGDMLFYTEQLERISSSRQEAHALYVGDYDRCARADEHASVLSTRGIRRGGPSGLESSRGRA